MASLVALSNFLNKFSFAQHGAVRTSSSNSFGSKERNLWGRGRNPTLIRNAIKKKQQKKNIKILDPRAKIEAISINV